MVAPSQSLATLRPDLAASFEEFDLEMDRLGFIATQVCPVLEVDRAAGNFGRIPIEQMLINRDTERAPGSGYDRSKFTFKPDTYATVEQGAEEPVDDNEAKMYASYFDYELLASRRARDAVVRNQEKRVAALIFNTTTFTGSDLTTAVSVPWSTSASATPIADVEAAVKKVYTNSGIWANALILNRLAFRDLRNCDEIVSRIKYSGLFNSTTGGITVDVLKQVFDLEYILVAGGVYNTDNGGNSASLSTIWDDTKAMVCHISPSLDVRRPTLARTFHWGEDGSSIGGTVETYRDETVRGNVVRVRHQTQERLMYTQLGHLLTAVR